MTKSLSVPLLIGYIKDLGLEEVVRIVHQYFQEHASYHVSHGMIHALHTCLISCVLMDIVDAPHYKTSFLIHNQRLVAIASLIHDIGDHKFADPSDLTSTLCLIKTQMQLTDLDVMCIESMVSRCHVSTRGFIFTHFYIHDAIPAIADHLAFSGQVGIARHISYHCDEVLSTSASEVFELNCSIANMAYLLGTHILTDDNYVSCAMAVKIDHYTGLSDIMLNRSTRLLFVDALYVLMRTDCKNMADFIFMHAYETLEVCKLMLEANFDSDVVMKAQAGVAAKVLSIILNNH